MSSKGENQDGNATSLSQVENEIVAKQQALLQNLYATWNDLGLDEEQKVNRVYKLWGCVFNLLEGSLAKETADCEDVKEHIKKLEKEISELVVELQLPKFEEITGTLIVKEVILQQTVDELSKTKKNRLQEFQELRSQELKYSKILGMLPLNLSSTTGVPTEKTIYELLQHVKMLQVEKKNRQYKFCMLKKELTAILEITELTPETPFEKEILSHNEETLSLSTETFKFLEQILTKAKSKRANLEKEKATLIEKLSVLWDILKVDKKERENFLSEHTDCHISNLNAIKEEISKYEEIKKQNISKYINSVKEELCSLWKKCFVVQSKNMLPRIQDDEINQTLLDIYDKEIAKWSRYYKDTEHIIQKIEKWNELWNQMIIFENKAADPNRFKNRGGNLLQEERQRKLLQKMLPELQEKILLDIENYEKETGNRFLYFGEKFEVYMEKQWGDRVNQKENEKLTRQKMRSNQIVNARTLGSTVSKQPFTAVTPKSAPNKLFKFSVRVPIYRTPNISAARHIPSTTARLKNNKQQNTESKGVLRNTLKEKNGNNPDVSECLDSTTYIEFAQKLNRSSRITHRSSVLSSRKIVGTRIVSSSSKRKSTQKPRKKVEPKLAPVRGKLDLPFLI